MLFSTAFFKRVLLHAGHSLLLFYYNRNVIETLILVSATDVYECLWLKYLLNI
jgi:hypothetical protein